MEPRQQKQRVAEAILFDLGFGVDDQGREEILSAADAVINELGPQAQRNVVVTRIATSWQAGHRLPLCLVKVGLEAAHA